MIDEVTKMPVEGVKVSFYNSPTSTSSLPPYTIFRDSTYTDAKGYFYKKWAPTKRYTQVNISKPNYYYYRDSKEGAKGDMGMMPIKPNKNFRLYIKNVPPVREDDSLFVNISYSTDSGYRSLPYRWFVGVYDTLVNVRVVYDDDWYRIRYNYKEEDGYWHYYNLFPACTPLDTCDIYIEY